MDAQEKNQDEQITEFEGEWAFFLPARVLLTSSCAYIQESSRRSLSTIS